MKKILLLVCSMIFTLSISVAASVNTDESTLIASDNKENKLSDEEISKLVNRVEEIRDMDKSDLSFSEKRVLRSELKGIKEDLRSNAPYVYVSVGTILLVALLLIILL